MLSRDFAGHNECGPAHWLGRVAEAQSARFVDARSLTSGARFAGVGWGCGRSCGGSLHGWLFGLGKFFWLRWRGGVAVGAMGWSAGGAGSCAGAAVGRGDAQLLTERTFQLLADVFVFLQEDAGVFAALAHAFAAEADPCAGFLEDALIDAEVDEVAFAGDAFAVEDVEFGFAERRGHLVLYDFAARAP